MSRASAAVAAVYAVMLAGGALPTPLYVLYRERFHFSSIVLTLIFAAYVVGAFAALLFLGRLADQVGRGRVVLASIIGAAAAALLFLFVADLAMLFVARAMSGFSIGLASGACTAWIAELEHSERHRGGTLIAVGANFAGLALGPPLAGCLAEYGPAPLRLPYLVFLALLIPAAILTRRATETVDEPVTRFADLKLRPRIGVPQSLRAGFASPAATAFAMFALLGFYTALTPSLLTKALHEPSHSVAGAIVAELFLAGVAALILTRRLSSRTAMLAGLMLLLPCLALIGLAQEMRSMTLLLGGTALGGVAAALGYRGSLEVVNQIAPRRQRAELISSYLVACYAGISLPVIGIGGLTEWAGASVADIAFAAAIAVLALGALAMGWKWTPEDRSPAARPAGRDA